MNRLLVAWLGIVAVACGSGPTTGDCPAGGEEACACPDGRIGGRACGAAGCDCSARYALVVDPAGIALGEVALGAGRDAVVLLENAAPHEVTIHSAAFLGDDAGSFALPDGVPETIPAGATVPLTLRFTAGRRGPAVARLRIEPLEADVAAVEVDVTARVPGPILVCTPPTVGFPDTYAGVPTFAAALCTNVGLASADDPARLVLDRLEVVGEGFSVDGEVELPPEGLAPGETVPVVVEFASDEPGDHLGTLIVGGPDGTAEVALVATALELPPCVDLDVPERIHAVVEEGVGVTLGLAIRNQRNDAPCLVREVRLCEATGPGFELVGGAVGPVVVPAAGAVWFTIELVPEADTCHEGPEGCVAIDLGSGDVRTIDLDCEPAEPEVLVAPSSVDFGTVRIGDEAPDREVQLINVVSVTAVFDHVELVAGAGDKFFVRSGPASGTTIPAGLAASFFFSYRPDHNGSDTGLAYFFLGDVAEPYVLSLQGWGISGE